MVLLGLQHQEHHSAITISEKFSFFKGQSLSFPLVKKNWGFYSYDGNHTELNSHIIEQGESTNNNAMYECHFCFPVIILVKFQVQRIISANLIFTKPLNGKTCFPRYNSFRNFSHTWCHINSWFSCTPQLHLFSAFISLFNSKLWGFCSV